MGGLTMVKAVLISIRPEWTAKIFDGRKTLELRKNRPFISVPFKCYIYCSSVTSMNLDNYVRVHRETEGRIDEWSGKVVGEFICDEIRHIHIPDNPTQDEFDMPIYENSCLSYERIRKYCNHGDGFFWHISRLRIYDTPEEIKNFVGIRKKNSNIELRVLENAPQSWCYVIDQKTKEGTI